MAFSTESEYRPYHPSESAASFYTHDNDRDYIVIQDLDHFNYAIHEYTHLVIARSGLRIPLWMNEGWADLNSTLTEKGKKAMIGDIIPGRREALLRNTWIPLADLDKVDQRSPMYNEREKASVFYGESWALVHMLFLAPQYRKKFDLFVQATVAGKSLADACLTAFGKSAAVVQQDLVKYIGNNQLDGAVFDVNLAGVQVNPVISTMTPLDTGLLLADVLTLTRKFPEAKTALEELSKQYPADPRIPEALGYLTIKMGDRAEGMRLLKESFDKGSNDALMCYRLAVLLHATSVNRGAVLIILRRAIQLQPDYPDARLQLGITLLESQDYAGSLNELRAISKIPEANALWYFAATGIDNAKLGHSEEARKNIDLARKWAKTPAQNQQLDQMMSALGAK